MIALRRLNNQPIIVNCDLIESIESTPETVVTLTSGNKLIVRDSLDEIRRRVIEFKREILGPKPSEAGPASTPVSNPRQGPGGGSR
jgi:flagellar protein FlbD